MVFEWQGELVVNWAPTYKFLHCQTHRGKNSEALVNSKNTNATYYIKPFNGGCQLLSVLSTMCFSMVQLR